MKGQDKMSSASELIERAEKETGQRVDADGGQNAAIDLLFGALARELRQSNHVPQSDVAAGTLIRHQMTPEYQRKQHSDAMLVNLLARGISPDAVSGLQKALKGGKDGK